MDQQDVSSASTEPGTSPIQNLSNRTWIEIRTGITIIAWFAMYNTFYGITRTLIGLMDTNYSIGEFGRLIIAAGVAVFLSFFIISGLKGSQY